jgi:hypothetical protein
MNSLIHLEAHVQLLKYSYEKYCGLPFPIPLNGESLVHAVYHNPEYVVLSHNTLADPTFTFANLKAQTLWKLSWEQFIGMPSRLSAKPDKVEKREALLQEARTHGYINNYKGIRVDSTGQEFYIENVTLWNLVDEQGVMHGQAALFNQWEPLIS